MSLVTFFPLLSTAAVSTLAAASIGIIEYPAGINYPQSITAGPDGNLWYLGASNAVIKMTTSGTVTAYGFPTGSWGPRGITAGPDGNLWFTLGDSNKVAKVTTSGSFTEYTVPTANSQPYGITAGPDGNVWFTEYYGNKVAKVTPAGNITEYPLPPAVPACPGCPPTNYPAAITAGPDGNLWTLEGGNATKVTTSGGITRYPTPSGVGNFDGIGPGPDGNVWFTEDTVNKVAKVTTLGSFTEFTAGSFNFTVGGAQAIVGGPDGNIWFTEPDGNKVARMTTSGAITEFAVPTANSGPLGIAVGPDGYMWFTEWRGNNVAKIGPVLNMYLGVAGPSSATPGSAFSLTVTAQYPGQATATGYRGTVHFVSSDSLAVLPADYTFVPSDSGTHTFAGVVLRSVGTQTITATDTLVADIHGSIAIRVTCLGACPAPAGTPGSRNTNPGPVGTPGARSGVTQSGAGSPGPRLPGTVLPAKSSDSAPGGALAAAAGPAPSSGVAAAATTSTPTQSAPPAGGAVATGASGTSVRAPARHELSLATQREPVSRPPDETPWSVMLLIPLLAFALALTVVRSRRAKSVKR